MPNLRNRKPESLPKLKPTSAVTAIKTKGNDLRRGRGKRTGGGWLNTMKVAFHLERPRPGPSSPSYRQIALVVVSAGLAIMVIRVVTHRKSHGAAVGPEAGQADTGQGEAGQAGTQAEDREAGATQPTSGNDNIPATKSSLTATVRSEMSRRGDAPTHTGGSE